MSLIKHRTLIILLNVLFTYVGLLLVNTWFDHKNFLQSYSLNLRIELEQAARAIDAAYFRQCLSNSHEEVIYPDLLRQDRYMRVAQSTGFLPLGSIPHTNTAYCNEGYGFVEYASDRFGFRNSDKQWDTPIDALLIGDSYIQGACVPDRAYLSALMSDSLGKNVVNVGIGSNGPNHYRALVETFVPIVKPRNAIVFFYPNDATQVDAEDPYLTGLPIDGSANYSLAGISEAGTNFYQQAVDIVHQSRVVDEDRLNCENTDLTHAATQKKIADNFGRSEGYFNKKASAAYFVELSSGGHFSSLFELQHISSALGALFEPSDAFDAKSLFPSSKAAIDELFKRCSVDCQPIIVLLPNSHYWRIDTRADAYFFTITDYVQNTYGQRPYEFLDARNFINSDELADFAPLGPHYSKEGYQKVAKALAHLLK